MNSGLVYVFTGEGKGKTSAAIGTAIRAVGAGMKVGWVSWYKQSSWKLSEIKILEKLGVEMMLPGKGFHMPTKTAPVGNQIVVDSATEREHKESAIKALEIAKEMVDKADVLVMDEVNNAVKDGLLDLFNLIELISSRGKTHLILTGRDADPEIIKVADLVTEMKKIKHPFDKGNLAIRGLDF